MAPTVRDELKELADDREAAEIAALAVADEELLDIFRTEAQEHLEVLRSFLERCGGDDGVAAPVPDEPMARALHTLTGSARMTGVESTAQVTAPLERFCLALQEQGAEADRPLLDLLERGIDALQRRIASLPGYGDEMTVLRELAIDLESSLARFEFGTLDEESGLPKATGENESEEEIVVAAVPEQDRARGGDPRSRGPATDRARRGDPRRGAPGRDRARRGDPRSRGPARDRARRGDPRRGAPGRVRARRGNPRRGAPGRDRARGRDPASRGPRRSRASPATPHPGGSGRRGAVPGARSVSRSSAVA